MLQKAPKRQSRPRARLVAGLTGSLGPGQQRLHELLEL